MNKPTRVASATPPRIPKARVTRARQQHDAPTHRDALALPDGDLAMHAGEQIFGVSRCSEEDPDRSRNDLGSMRTLSAVSPDHENIHPDWIGRFSATMCSKHLGGMEGDGVRALRPSRAQADANYMTIAVQNVAGSCRLLTRRGTMDKRRGGRRRSFDVGSALHPTAVHAPSLVPLYRALAITYASRRMEPQPGRS